MTLNEHLISLGACQAGLDFATGKTALETWDTCERPDWLGWWLAKTNSNPENRRLAKLYCRIWDADITPLLPESKQHGFVEMLSALRDWCEEPTEENRSKARALDLARPCARDRARDCDLAFASTLDLARDLALDLARDLALDLARDKKWCNAIRAEFACPWKERA